MIKIEFNFIIFFIKSNVEFNVKALISKIINDAHDHYINDRTITSLSLYRMINYRSYQYIRTMQAIE